MVTRRQGGFTLIEISIVIAITMLLAAAIISTQTGARNTSQFRSSLQDVVSYLDQARTNSQTHKAIISTGDQTSKIIFGKLITITPGSDTITSTDIIGSNSGGGNIATGASVDQLALEPDSVLSHMIQTAQILGVTNSVTGVETTAANPYYVVYSTVSNQIISYDFGQVGIGSVLNPSLYPTSALSGVSGGAAIDTVTLRLKSENGNFTGHISITGTNNGAVTTVIDP